MMNHRILFLIAFGAAACGSGNQEPAKAPTTTSANVEPAPKAAEPAKTVEEAKPAEPVEVTPVETKAATPDKCEGSWTCVSVPLAGAKKVDKRETQLIGDPAIDATVSGMTDDARGPAKLELDGKVYEVAVKRLPGEKAVVVLRGNGPELVLDKHDSREFTYVGVIAAKKDNAILIDVRWMR